MKKRIKKNLISIIFTFSAVIVFSFNITASIIVDPSEVILKDKFGNNSFSENTKTNLNETQDYMDIMQNYKEKNYKFGKDNIILNINDAITSNNESTIANNPVSANNEKVLLWDEKNDSIEYNINVENSGLYEISIEYYLVTNGGSSAVRALEIDGKQPFKETSVLNFNRYYKDASEPKKVFNGDEVKPSQVEISGWRNQLLRDNRGFYSSPFQFYFEKGEHKLKFIYIDQSMYLNKITIKAPKEFISYNDLLKVYKDKRYENAKDIITFEAENNVVERTDPTVSREYDGDPATSPSEIGFVRLNTIGGYKWRKGNQTIKWKFTVPSSGLYKIGMRINQGYTDGLPVYRQILIDDEIPFSEFISYKIPYNLNWKIHTLSDSKTNSPYMFYFDAGKEHTISMSVNLGDITPIVLSLYDDAVLASRVIRDIVKITGNNPDPNYDYELDIKVPNLLANLKTLMYSFSEKVKYIRAISTKSPVSANSFEGIIKQLNDMIDDPSKISRRLNDLRSVQDSASSYYNSLQDMPLAIDNFELCSVKNVITGKNVGVFKRFSALFKAFLVSFYKDYNSVGNTKKDNTVIDVWVSRGREWAELIKESSDTDFTSRTNISVNINTLPGSQLEAGSVNALMLAIASNKAPDVCLGVGVTSPVEYAIRDAVYDLSSFKDFEEIRKRFLKNIMIPYEYRGKYYALPETMDFRAMFYRKDIIDELKIKLPQTWDDVYSNLLPTLYQNNMEFYVPADLTPFLFQNGGSYYSKDGKKTALDSTEAFSAFKEFTELFTNYGVPISASFYMRMRTGEMPIGLGSFGDFMTLTVAAPELAGKWAITEVPGHKRSDGTIDRSVGGITSQGGIILKDTKHPDKSWEFLKWWTDENTQTNFSRELEGLIGVQARWNSANVNSFLKLSWNKQDIMVIKNMWDWSKETPVVLGGYFTGRHVSNAWNRVVLADLNVRDSLEQAVEDINKELKAKQNEYGFS